MADINDDRIRVVALALINFRRIHHGMPAIDWEHPALGGEDKKHWKAQALAAVNAWESSEGVDVIVTSSIWDAEMRRSALEMLNEIGEVIISHQTLATPDLVLYASLRYSLWKVRSDKEAAR